MRGHRGGTHLRAEKEEEAGADLNGSASGLSVVHRMRISDAGLPIGGGPVTLIHNQDGPNFPPDGQCIDARIVYNVAVIWRGYEDIPIRRTRSLSQGRERTANIPTGFRAFSFSYCCASRPNNWDAGQVKTLPQPQCG